MTQKQWQNLVAFAARLGIRSPEDVVQDALLEDLELHGKVTGHTVWLLQKRSRAIPKKADSVYFAVYEQTTELETTWMDLQSILEKMVADPKRFTFKEVSVFVLRSIGLSYKEIGDTLGFSESRGQQIQTRYIEKLKDILK